MTWVKLLGKAKLEASLSFKPSKYIWWNASSVVADEVCRKPACSVAPFMTCVDMVLSLHPMLQLQGPRFLSSPEKRKLRSNSHRSQCVVVELRISNLQTWFPEEYGVQANHKIWLDMAGHIY